jgi:hypothetical protein
MSASPPPSPRTLLLTFVRRTGVPNYRLGADGSSDFRHSFCPPEVISDIMVLPESSSGSGENWGLLCFERIISGSCLDC